MRKFAVSCAGILSLLIVSSAWACSGGQEWTSISGKYLTDVTNDTPSMTPGMTVHFDFALLNREDPRYEPNDLVPYSTTEITLTRGDTQLFTKQIPYDADRELSGFDYQFPQRSGTYTLHIRYLEGTTELATADIPLTVKTVGLTLSLKAGIYAGLAMLATVLCILIVVSMQRKSGVFSVRPS